MVILDGLTRGRCCGARSQPTECFSESHLHGKAVPMYARKLKTWLKLAVLVGFLTGAVYFFRFTERGREISPEYVLDSIESHGPLTARLIYVAVYIFGTGILLPGTVLSFAGAVP